MDLEIINKILDKVKWYASLGIHATHIIVNPYTFNKILNNLKIGESYIVDYKKSPNLYTIFLNGYTLKLIKSLDLEKDEVLVS